MKSIIFIILDNLTIAELLLRNGAGLNRLSYLNYSWPKESSSFQNLEPALITATRHGMKKENLLIFVFFRKNCELI